MDICAASRAAGLVARSDIAKCHGSIGDLTPKCISCVRILAPEGVGQQYAEPTITGDVCSQYASVERYGHLFVAAETAVAVAASAVSPELQSEVHGG